MVHGLIEIAQDFDCVLCGAYMNNNSVGLTGHLSVRKTN